MAMSYWLVLEGLYRRFSVALSPMMLRPTVSAERTIDKLARTEQCRERSGA
jgi:hypothetical protein